MSAPDAVPPRIDDRAAAVALLRWQIEMGADEAIAEFAPNRLAPAPPAPPAAAPPPLRSAPPRP
ncbi:MAG: hypothetical protein ACREFB_02215, partial [Stellaceae bacterium]